MKSILIYIILICSFQQGHAQDIINKLGGHTANETYDVTDDRDNSFFRIQGNKMIGINNVSPEANFDVKGTVKMLGGWGSTFTTETAYQALSDGFVSATITNNTIYSFAQISGKTDVSNPPTTIRMMSSIHLTPGNQQTVFIIMPVRKGDYWLITDNFTGLNTSSVAINWIPLGQ